MKTEKLNVWVIQDGEVIPYLCGGAREMRCGTLVKELLRQGAEVVWWASTFDHASKKHLYGAYTVVSPLTGLTINLLHGPGYYHNQSFARLIHQHALANEFNLRASSLPLPDIIIGNIPFPELAESAVSFARDYKVPVAIFVEDMWPDIYLSAIPKHIRILGSVILWREFRRIKKVFSSADAIWAVSDTYLKWALGYAKRGRTPIDAVFPLGYPSIKRSPGISREDYLTKIGIDPAKVVVTFAGAFAFSYDLETIVKCAEALNRCGDHRFHFLLIGAGDKLRPLRKLAAGLPNVSFKGWMAHQELFDALSCSDIGLAAYSAHATQTLPYKPFEYMAAGLPIVSSLQGELRALIEENNIGASYQASDPQSLLAALRYLADSPGRIEENRTRVSAVFEKNYRADVIYPAVVRQIRLLVN